MSARAEGIHGMNPLHPCPGSRHRYAKPPVMVGSEGCYLIDSAGNRYLDCTSGGGAMNAGYRNPMILNAVVDQTWRLERCGPACLTDQTAEFVATLGELTAGALSCCTFLESEWEARQTALQLAAAATGRPASAVLAADVAPRVLGHEELERSLGDLDQQPAAILADPTFLEAGLCLPPSSYWSRIRDLSHERGALLIFDETRSGMNRTGRWFAGEHWNVVPDILVLGAALTNGIAFGAVLTTGKIAERCGIAERSSPPPNPVGAAAAMATIRFHRTAALAGRSARHGERLLVELREVIEHGTPGRSGYARLFAADQPPGSGSAQRADAGRLDDRRAEHARRCSSLARPRGLGLLLAVDVVNEAGEPDPARCDRYLEQLKDWGFLLGKAGTHSSTLTILPPLTITEEQLPLIAAALAELDRTDLL